MGDLKIVGLPEHRKVLAAINKMSMRSGFSRMEDAVKFRRDGYGDSASFLSEGTLNLSARGRFRELVNLNDAKSIISRTEDSLETILDVLAEMQTIAADSTTIDGRFGTGGKAKKSEADLRDAHKSQLDEYSAEIASIIADSQFEGAKLFESGSSAFRFLVDIGPGDGYAVSIGALSVDTLSVAEADLDVSTTDLSTDTLGAIEAAITLVERRLDTLGDVTNRLAYHADHPGSSDYEEGYSRIADERFAKVQMDLLKLEIARQAGKAMLAQGSVSPRNVLRLVDTKEPETAARIYSIDEARKESPRDERLPQELASLARFRFAHIQRIDGSSAEPYSGNAG